MNNVEEQIWARGMTYIVRTFPTKQEALSAVDKLLMAGLQLYRFNEGMIAVNSISADGDYLACSMITVIGEASEEELRAKIDIVLEA